MQEQVAPAAAAQVPKAAPYAAAQVVLPPWRIKGISTHTYFNTMPFD